MQERTNKSVKKHATIISSLAAIALLGGCSALGGGDKKDTPTIGKRIDILGTEADSVAFGVGVVAGGVELLDVDSRVGDDDRGVRGRPVGVAVGDGLAVDDADTGHGGNVLVGNVIRDAGEGRGAAEAGTDRAHSRSR